MEKRRKNKDLLKMQENILRSRGLVRKKEKTTKHVRLSNTCRDHLKTTRMRLIELQFGSTIEEILLSGTVTAVAKKYNLDKGTVSKWIYRLCLIMDTDQLPSCADCNQAREECLSGRCWKVETFDSGLVEVKKQQMIKEGVITIGST